MSKHNYNNSEEQKVLIEKIKTESIKILLLFVFFSILFFIFYRNDSKIIVIKTLLSMFWLFIIPGYFLMLHWHNKLDLTERIVIGTIMSAGLLGTLSYLSGLLGFLNYSHHHIYPPIIILGGLALAWFDKKKE